MQCWLVERDFDDKGLVRFVYATPDGERRIIKERSAARLAQYDVTAAIEVGDERLEPVEDAELVARYASEVERVSDRHDPDETL